MDDSLCSIVLARAGHQSGQAGVEGSEKEEAKTDNSFPRILLRRMPPFLIFGSVTRVRACLTQAQVCGFEEPPGLLLLPRQ